MTIAHRDHLLPGWEAALERTSYHLQPILNVHAGMVEGYEALLRGWDDAGFASIPELFDAAARDGVAVDVNGILLGRAVATFLRAERAAAHPGGFGRLYFNIDNRLFDEDNVATAIVEQIRETGFPLSRIVLELSELHPIPEEAYATRQIPRIRAAGAFVALDDFGAGHSSIRALYRSGIDVLKIDRYFVDGIDRAARKRLFITNLVRTAHALGLRVIAEGVETEHEFYALRDAGCDLVQGYLIARPQALDTVPAGRPAIIDTLLLGDRRAAGSEEAALRDRIRIIDPIRRETPAMDVLQRFRSDKELSYLPVVGSRSEPLGLLLERDLKEYVYSPYGIALLTNATYTQELYQYVRRVPVVRPETPVERILEVYALSDEAPAVIVADRGRYAGVLESRALLELVHEREVALARDENPLTGLSGNARVTSYVMDAMEPTTRPRLLAYFDFDNFKPFNDAYGFRIGDRVIQLFASMLRQEYEMHGFVGHVGGDDFFVGLETSEPMSEYAAIERLQRRFRDEVRSYYGDEDRSRGYIAARNRAGIMARFPLLTVSAAILVVPPSGEATSVAGALAAIAQLKHASKRVSGVPAIAALIRAPDAAHS